MTVHAGGHRNISLFPKDITLFDRTVAILALRSHLFGVNAVIEENIVGNEVSKMTSSNLRLTSSKKRFI